MKKVPLFSKQIVNFSIRHGANRTRIYNLAGLF